MEFKHYSVMLDEVLDGLKLADGGVYFDGTLGGGGHTGEILKRTKDTMVIGVDQDGDAIKSTSEKLGQYGKRLVAVHANFKEVDTVLDRLQVDKLDGAVLDLGVSSYQLDNFERGFSYRSEDAPLDMRMDATGQFSAYDIVNGYDEKRLTDIFFEYGEERFSKRIAANIVSERKKEDIITCGQLVDIIRRSIPKAVQMTGGHPAKRVFQAIRIEVNRELDGLDKAVTSIVRRLKVGGRLCVITFHSLEDRIIKHTFKYLECDCICDKSAPICVCDKVSEIKIITNKPILPSGDELAENSRSQSAKLRIAEKIHSEKVIKK